MKTLIIIPVAVTAGIDLFFVNVALFYSNEMLAPGSPYNASLMNAWTVMRNIAIGLLTLAILVIAFANILNIQTDVYGLQSMIPKIIIAILLALFSYAICDFFLQFEQTLNNEIMVSLARTGLNIFNTGGGNVFSNSVTGMFSDAILKSAAGTVDVGVSLLLMLPLSIIMFVASVFLGFVLIERIVMIYLLVAVAPLAFIIQVMPFLSQYTKMWWTHFLKWVFMGLVINLVLFVGITLLVTANPGTVWIGMLILSASFIMAAMVPMKFGGMMANTVGGWIKGGINAGKKYFGGEAKDFRDAAVRGFLGARGKTSIPKPSQSLYRQLAKVSNGQLLSIDGSATDPNAGTGTAAGEAEIAHYLGEIKDKTGPELIQLLSRSRVDSLEEVALLRQMATRKDVNWGDPYVATRADRWLSDTVGDKTFGGTLDKENAGSKVKIADAGGANAAAAMIKKAREKSVGNWDKDELKWLAENQPQLVINATQSPEQQKAAMNAFGAEIISDVNQRLNAATQASGLPNPGGGNNPVVPPHRIG